MAHASPRQYAIESYEGSHCMARVDYCMARVDYSFSYEGAIVMRGLVVITLPLRKPIDHENRLE